MFRHAVQFKLIFVAILYMRLCLMAHAQQDICDICSCQESHTIDCSNKNLSSVPQSIPSSAKILHLNLNHIRNIEEGTFQNPNSLEELNLNDNNIQNIEEGTFRNLSCLKKLRLNNNNIKNIEEGTFQTLSHLTLINLGYNEIKNIKVPTFHNLHELITLNLNKNNIRDIEEGTFETLSSLKYLRLDNNFMENIDVRTFEKLSSLDTLDLNHNQIRNIEKGTFQNLPNLRTLYLNHNNIKNIQEGTFQDIPSLENLFLHNNNISDIEDGTFQNLPSLKVLRLDRNNIMNIGVKTFQYLSTLSTLALHYNNIKTIEQRIFQSLYRLRILYLRNNQIKTIEDGSFLFLSSISFLDLRSNNALRCGCHLPAVINYLKKTYSRFISVFGSCHADLGNSQGKVIGVMAYTQCTNYSLFQPDLQCETCSGMMCNGSEVTNCTGEEPVCQNKKISMNNGELKFERSCSDYSKCVEAMKNNTLTCSEDTSDSSCLACCTGDLCNKNEFIGWTHSFVFHLINSIDPSWPSESRVKRESRNNEISKTMELEFSNLTGTFAVEYCSLEKNRKIFTIYCTVLRGITKDQVFNKMHNILTTSEKLRNLGIQQHNMEFFAEKDCNADTTSTPNGTLSWPMTEVGTTATILCPGSIATRHCSSKMAVHLDPIISQDMASRKCLQLTGIWQEPDMSQCYEVTEKLKNIKSQDINKGNIKGFSNKLHTISQSSVYITEEDITLAVDIYEKMLLLIPKVNANITLNILRGINNMIDTPEKNLEKAEKANNVVSRMLDVIERIPEKISLEDQQVTVLYSNLGIGVLKVGKDTFNGTDFGVLYSNKKKYISASPVEQDDTDFISLPKSLLKHLKDKEWLTVTRISLSSLKSDKLYKIIQKCTIGTHTKISSHIIAASVPNITITNLDEPVTISLHLIDKAATNPQCVYWDGSHWSTKGCSVSDFIPGKKVVCTCDHLTSFAILMNEGNIKMFNLYLLYLTLAVAYHLSFSFLQ